MSVSIRTDLFRPFKEIVRRRGKLKKNDRGLPEEEARNDLARTYLELQNQLWPELSGTGLLSPVTDEAVKSHADSLRDSFTSGVIKVISIPVGLIIAIAAAYVRYSCDHSSTRSLDQQLRNILEGAKQMGYFIPWEYVFADAAISGTTSDRRGYQMCKELIRQTSIQFECLLVDEIGRANRNTIESLMLGRLVMYYNKRLVGVKDGLDSRQTQFQTLLVMFSLMQQQFVESLREKVYRGMKDKFLRGGNIRPPAFGYKIVQVKTPEGNLVVRSNGKIKTERVIDEVAAEEILQAFWRYAMEGWSAGRIARDFNSRNVGGSSSWDTSNILKMLRRESYVGREYERMTRKEMNPETGIIRTVKLPREQWLSREVPHLKIIHDPVLWEKTQQRLDQCSAAYTKRKDGTGKRISRTHVFPSLLVRPICSHCKTELSIGGSGKYSSLCCLNGSRGKKQCPLGTFKSTRMIEKAMMSFLTKEIITKSFLEAVIKEANDFLEQERHRPQKKIAKEPVGLKDLIKKRDHLSALVEQYGAKDVAALINRLRGLERKIEELKLQHESERLKCLPLPQPITVSDMGSLVVDLTDLLKDNVAKSAPIIRQLLGDVEVEEVKDNKKTRPVWIARFTLNAVPFMLELAKSGNLPTTEQWEYLTQRGWKISRPAQLEIKEVPKYEEYAAISVEMGERLTQKEIALKLGITETDVSYAQDFGKNGIRPKTKPMKIHRFRALAEKVFHLIQNKSLTIRKAAKQLGETPAMAKRAYDHQCSVIERSTGTRPERPFKGRGCRLSPEVECEIHRMLKDGRRPCEVYRKLGCSRASVSLRMKRLKDEVRK